MTNKKSTKKALISSALCLLLCMSMLVGTTFAWFTDSVSTTNNIITAGNLDVNLYWSTDASNWTAVNSNTNIFKTGTLWEPGHTEVVYLKVVNEGTLALQYTLDVNVASEIEGTNVDGKAFNLSDYILYNVTDGVTTFANSADARGDESGNKLNAPYNKATQLLEKGQETVLTMVVFMPTTVGNEANYKTGTTAPSINLGITLLATQYTKENDSYGPNYDAAAKLPIADADALAAAMTEGGIYILAADITVDSTAAMVVPVGKEVILDLNGHTISKTVTNSDKNGDGKFSSADNNYTFQVKGDLTVLGEGTISYTHLGADMGWNALASAFTVEGGELTLGAGVNVINYGGTSMAYGVDVNTTGGESVLNVNGATILSTYIGVREFNNSKTAQAIVNLNSGIVSGDRRDIWVHNPSAAAVDANGIVNIAEGYDVTKTTQDASSFYGRIYDFDYGYILVNSATALQTALDNAEGEVTIKLGMNINGNVIATQKPDVKITIDGNGNEFNGVILVDGDSARYETAALTIQNVNFDANGISADACIRLGDGVKGSGVRYSNHVTVKNCTFSGTGNDKVAVKSYEGGDFNVTIEGCTVNAGMHSLAQLKNVEKGLKVVDCKVYSKNGLNVNNTPALEMSDCIFDVQGYAVRFGSDSNTTNETFNIANSTLKSACAESGDAVIEIRAGASNATLNLSNTTIEGTVEMKGHENATISKN